MNCPVCRRPIEPHTVVACKRCFGLFPRKVQQRIRELYVREQDYSGMLAKWIRLTRERHPETRPQEAVVKIAGLNFPAGFTTPRFTPGATAHIGAIE
jgi:predicted nucleic acid-binding Zn ribbon protein